MYQNKTHQGTKKEAAAQSKPYGAAARSKASAGHRIKECLKPAISCINLLHAAAPFFFLMRQPLTLL